MFCVKHDRRAGPGDEPVPRAAGCDLPNALGSRLGTRLDTVWMRCLAPGGGRGHLRCFRSRTLGTAASVKTITSSPVAVLMSW